MPSVTFSAFLKLSTSSHTLLKLWRWIKGKSLRVSPKYGQVIWNGAKFIIFRYPSMWDVVCSFCCDISTYICIISIIIRTTTNCQLLTRCRSICQRSSKEFFLLLSATALAFKKLPKFENTNFLAPPSLQALLCFSKLVSIFLHFFFKLVKKIIRFLNYFFFKNFLSTFS